MKVGTTWLQSVWRALWRPVTRIRDRRAFKRWLKLPLSEQQASMAAMAYWPPNEDWSDWKP